jgi:hypothetical protein
VAGGRELRMEDRNKIVERLKATDTRRGGFKQALTADGSRRGRHWAAEAATVPELLRLAGMEQDCRADCKRVAKVILSDDYTKKSAREFWWNFHDSDGAPPPEFVENFIKGALDVWSDVQDDVNDDLK